MARNTTRPWDRTLKETPEEWELFELFLRERDVSQVAALYFPDDKVGVGELYVREVQRAHRWNPRVAAYDRWLSEQRDAAVTHLVKLEMRTIAKRRVKILRDMFNVYENVRKQVLPDNATENDKIKLGDAVVYNKIAQVILSEYREVEKSNPMDAGKDNPLEQQLVGAAERMKAMIEANRAKAQADASGAPLSEPEPPVLQ